MLLKDISTIRPGYHLRGKLRPLPDGNMGIVQMSDVRSDGSIDYPRLKRIAVDELKSDYLLERGDVLVINRGQRNVSALITKKLDNTVAASHFFWIRPKSPNLSPEFLAWYLNQPPTQEALARFRKASSIPLLSREGVESLPIPIPPLEVQEKIAATGALIKKESEILEQLAELRSQLVYAQLMSKVSSYQNGESNV